MVENILRTLVYAPHFYLTVLIPLLMLFTWSILNKKFILWKELPWFVISWTLTYKLAYWIEDDTALILAPISVLIVVLTSFKHKDWSILEAMFFCYLSFLTIDLYVAYMNLYEKIGWWFLTGIGGAGLKDGLIVFPIFTAICVMYINSRKSGKLLFTKQS